MKMMERFEQQYAGALSNSNPGGNTDHCTELYQKLHDEIIYFRDSVKDILNEMQPIKEQLIKNITQIIKKAVPNSEVKVYGSHATKLCLPWSDIDIVIIPPPKSANDHHHYHPKSVLSQISRELQNEIQNAWVKQVNFVENATVPVVKISCQVANGNNKFMTPQLEKYKYFLDQPFNIDITQMTDHHNGLECVRLVQDFLAENEVIEPLILVLKQFLKTC